MDLIDVCRYVWLQTQKNWFGILIVTVSTPATDLVQDQPVQLLSSSAKFPSTCYEYISMPYLDENHVSDSSTSLRKSTRVYIISVQDQCNTFISCNVMNYILKTRTPVKVLSFSAIVSLVWIPIIIIRVFCPKAGTSLQAEKPRLRFCRRQVFHRKLRNQDCSFTRDLIGAIASRCFPRATLSLASEQTLKYPRGTNE